jgi:hypothetical protein
MATSSFAHEKADGRRPHNHADAYGLRAICQSARRLKSNDIILLMLSCTRDGHGNAETRLVEDGCEKSTLRSRSAVIHVLLPDPVKAEIGNRRPRLKPSPSS